MTFVLVHGGGFGASCWDPLVPLLEGHVHAVDLPGRGGTPGDLAAVGIADFVEAVVTEIVANDLVGVTLVGHSMAGLTLPGVAERATPRLRRLVFISCAVPPHGSSLAEVLGSLSPTVAAIADGLGDEVVDPGGSLHPDLARAMFCNDMNEEEAAFTLERLVPEALGVLAEPADLTGLRHPVPRTYVRLTRDASISPEAQDQMIANLGGAEVIDLDAGHMAMISRPDELASLLNGL